MTLRILVCQSNWTFWEKPALTESTVPSFFPALYIFIRHRTFAIHKSGQSWQSNYVDGMFSHFAEKLDFSIGNCGYTKEMTVVDARVWSGRAHLWKLMKKDNAFSIITEMIADNRIIQKFFRETVITGAIPTVGSFTKLIIQSKRVFHELWEKRRFSKPKTFVSAFAKV